MRRLHWLMVLLPVLAMGCDAVLSVHGRVVDETGAAISGAKVSVYSGSTSATSDERGCFFLETICPFSKHEAPVDVEARGFTAYRGTIAAPGLDRVLARLPHEGGGGAGSIEKVSAESLCPDPRRTR